MSKQWTSVLAIVAGLGLGAWALVKFGPRPEGVEVGKQAPNFTAVDVNSGQPVSLKEHYHGQVTLVNVWATYCIPCRSEMPAMEKLYREFSGAGFRIAAVSIDEVGSDEVKRFQQQYGLTFDILHDRSGAIQTAYQTTGVPESFLLDKNGTIVKKVIGEHPWSSPASRRIVAQLLGVSTPESSVDSSWNHAAPGETSRPAAKPTGG
jgi:peroxiredoxin